MSQHLSAADAEVRRARQAERVAPFMRRLEDLLWLPYDLVPAIAEPYDQDHQELRHWLIRDQLRVAEIEANRSMALAARALSGDSDAQKDLERISMNGLNAMAVAAAEIRFAPLDRRPDR